VEKILKGGEKKIKKFKKILKNLFEKTKKKKKKKSYDLSAVKCRLICALYFLKLHLLSVVIDMQYIPVCVIGN